VKDRLYFKNKIFKLRSNTEFNVLALELFLYQAELNKVYKKYLELLGVKPGEVNKVEDIPHLPISFFKSHEVKTGEWSEQEVFTSSGTTSMQRSKHLINDLDLYEQSFLTAFGLKYGDPAEWCFLALLPSYLERDGSSLIYMADKLIESSGNSNSGFYLDEYEKLLQVLNYNQKHKIKTLLLGVSFALVELAGRNTNHLPDITIMETGGMKGRRKEMTRQELHTILTSSFGVSGIHSEYGMTELMSQAYSKEKGLFQSPPWMKVNIRDTRDPFSRVAYKKTGGINVIDLANIDSCAFIETQDLGRLLPDGSFEVLGRFDQAEIRGCNLLIA